MSGEMSAYDRLTILVPPAVEESVAAELWRRGTLGLELADAADGRLRVEAYFPAGAGGAVDLSAWRGRGVEVVAAETFAERDWLAAYRAQARPFDVGRRLRVDPRDPSAATPPSAGDRVLLRIPARTAFGTGSHESTRLALELLEALEPAGLEVLDVGTGSGILACAALRFGARAVVGFDLDPAAALIAGQNARLNAVAPRLFAGRLAALRRGRRFDLALVNVLPGKIRREVPRIAGLLRRGGRAISSGNLEGERVSVLAAWAGAGLEPVAERRAGEWIAFLLAGRP